MFDRYVAWPGMTRTGAQARFGSASATCPSMNCPRRGFLRSLFCNHLVLAPDDDLLPITSRDAAFWCSTVIITFELNRHGSTGSSCCQVVVYINYLLRTASGSAPRRRQLAELPQTLEHHRMKC